MNTVSAITSISFWKNYIITMRPYLLFVSGITGIAGLSFAPDMPLPATILLATVFFLSYGFGQALTDCFQMDTDAISSPYRPLIQGVVLKNDVLLVSLTALILCGVALALFSVANLLLALGCVIGLSTYTYFKRRWWGGPLYNGWIVAVLCVIGYNSGANGMHFTCSPQFLLALTSVLFGYANFVLVGYFKDVSADSKTGYNTFLVVFGRKVSSIVSDVFAVFFVGTGVLSLYATLDAGTATESSFAAIALCTAAIVYAIQTQVQLHRVHSDEDAYLAVAPSVHAYIIMLMAVSVGNKPAWCIPLLIFYSAFRMTLRSRPERAQI